MPEASVLPKLLLPNMTASAWLFPMLKGIWNHDEGKPASGSAVRRWVAEGKVKVNGENVSPQELIDFPVYSVVLNPKSEKRRVTLF
ncbi:MAG TPA: hypothetical protein VN081_04745 [Dongiaceae bacterium]|nr:hypothetical protein [Dongiaceae bacterium]